MQKGFLLEVTQVSYFYAFHLNGHNTISEEIKLLLLTEAC